MNSHGQNMNELKEILKMDNVVLLDVRNADEIEAAPLESNRDVLKIPVGSVEAEAKAAIPEQDAHLIVFCRSGNRASKAIGILQNLGYSKLYNGGGVTDMNKIMD